eukprot:gnl/TRDRNA2_/TRDRNA2_42686_c0_seq1.p1 gnl/TRDRNA2_/TRDRNA2_42686_c0~~gnl/TRDRNA2_/TRDRNA2_42686_c0_seq1.p1  ORF type:complete len:672 (+),score=94.10 gnl/TRDRNA2_/TRDRNA2_42686_c0_seq1:119-2134(+)
MSVMMRSSEAASHISLGVGHQAPPLLEWSGSQAPSRREREFGGAGLTSGGNFRFGNAPPGFGGGGATPSFPSSQPTIVPAVVLKGTNRSYLLTLHFLGLSGLPTAGWFERAPSYEFIVHVGGSAKRLRPRVPAPPLTDSDVPTDIGDMLPGEAPVQINERLSVRMVTPVEFFQVDVWEERLQLLDFGGKAPVRRLIGHCYVPLEQQFNRRPCTWSIVSRSEKEFTTVQYQEQNATDVGFLTCKFHLVATPGPVRSLHVADGAVGQSEVHLLWTPPEDDGGTPLRGYLIEAHDAATEPPRAPGGPSAATTPATSAPATAQPSCVMRDLRGNTAYTFHVWAVSEAGPGAGADVQAHTGPVEPGTCGPPRLVANGEGMKSNFFIEWSPPLDTGGAPIVAYRVWLRPIMLDGIGGHMGWVDLGLFEHSGEPLQTQCAPLRIDALPQCPGCLCSVSALSAAGLSGDGTQEVLAVPQSPQMLQPQPLQQQPRMPMETQTQTQQWAAAGGSSYSEWENLNSVAYEAGPDPLAFRDVALEREGEAQEWAPRVNSLYGNDSYLQEVSGMQDIPSESALSSVSAIGLPGDFRGGASVSGPGGLHGFGSAKHLDDPHTDFMEGPNGADRPVLGYLPGGGPPPPVSSSYHGGIGDSTPPYTQPFDSRTWGLGSRGSLVAGRNL